MSFRGAPVGSWLTRLPYALELCTQGDADPSEKEQVKVSRRQRCLGGPAAVAPRRRTRCVHWLFRKTPRQTVLSVPGNGCSREMEVGFLPPPNSPTSISREQPFPVKRHFP